MEGDQIENLNVEKFGSSLNDITADEICWWKEFLNSELE